MNTFAPAAQVVIDVFRSVHGLAFLLGAIAYLAYSAVFVIRLHLLRSVGAQSAVHLRPKIEDISGEDGAVCQAVSEGRLWRATKLGIVGTIIATLSFLAFSLPKAVLPSCPADTEDTVETIGQAVHSARLADLSAVEVARQSPGAIAKGFKLSAVLAEARARAETDLPGTPPMRHDPLSHLAHAHAVENDELMASASDMVTDSGMVRLGALTSCVTWEAEDVPSVAELFAQLECQSELMERSDAAALVAASRRTMNLLRIAGAADAPELAGTWGAAQVEWARITQRALESRCIGIHDEIRALRTSQGPVGDAIAALRRLRKLLEALRESLTAFRHADVHLAAQAQAGDVDAGDELAELREAQGVGLASLLQLLQEGRALAQVLPRSHEALRSAIRCDSELLAELEALALKTAGGSKDAAAVFAAGGYWSELAVAEERAAPFFTPRPKPTWVAGSGGSHIPDDMALAEELLLRAEEATLGSLEGDRAASRALRLYRHAKFLALKHHDAAAEWRYRESARVAASAFRRKLAAHSLTRLGYFLMLRSRHQEATEAIEQALQHFQDPLAVYLQVRLARVAGELTTEEQLLAAEQRLFAAAGKMPSAALEEERERDHASIRWWRTVTEAGLRHCVDTNDVAHVLICVFSGIIFGVPV